MGKLNIGDVAKFIGGSRKDQIGVIVRAIEQDDEREIKESLECRFVGIYFLGKKEFGCFFTAPFDFITLYPRKNHLK